MEQLPVEHQGAEQGVGRDAGPTVKTLAGEPRRRHGRWVALAASLLLHGGGLLGLASLGTSSPLGVSPLQARAPRSRLPPVQFELLTPPRSEPRPAVELSGSPLSPTELSPPSTTAAAVTDRAVTRPAPPGAGGAGPAQTSESPRLGGPGPRVAALPGAGAGVAVPHPAEAPPADGVVLFAPGAIAGAARGDGAAEGDALAQARLDGFAQEIGAYQRGAGGDVTPALIDFGNRLDQWFIPPLAPLEERALLGFGPGAAISRHLKVLQDERPIGSAGDAMPLDPSGRKAWLGRPNTSGGIFSGLFCFGACDAAGHDIAFLAVVVDIDHDERGRPEQWRVHESSGDAGFDAAALDAVREGHTFVEPTLFAAAPRAVWTRWRLESTAYRWGRMELLLDPLWTPPGYEVGNDPLGKTTVVRAVKLVAVRY